MLNVNDISEKLADWLVSQIKDYSTGMNYSIGMDYSTEIKYLKKALVVKIRDTLNRQAYFHFSLNNDNFVVQIANETGMSAVIPRDFEIVASYNICSIYDSRGILVETF